MFSFLSLDTHTRLFQEPEKELERSEMQTHYGLVHFADACNSKHGPGQITEPWILSVGEPIF